MDADLFFKTNKSRGIMILVTGGAGFIGSNFLLDWLDLCDEPVVNLTLSRQ